VAFYADIYNMSGYPKIVQKFGPSESCEWIAIPSSLSATGCHWVPLSATECH
jgi:hypothetical protein